MTGTNMKGFLLCTLATVICSSVQARSVSKELLELNNHINNQFGFDYSNDEEFFSLIGVKSSDNDSGSDSYEYYDFGNYDRKVKEEENEYDEHERNAGANEAVEELDTNEYVLSNNESEQEEGGVISSEHENSDEYDENNFNDGYNDEENRKLDNNLVLVVPEEEKLKDFAYSKHNKDDKYVNDYDETHEVFGDEDNYDENEPEEDENEDYDEDYDYEGDDSEEYNESYFNSVGEEEKSEEYIDEEENEEDYYENYDYNGEENNKSYANSKKDVNDNIDGDSHTYDKKLKKNIDETKIKEHEEYENYAQADSDEPSNVDGKLHEVIDEEGKYYNYDSYDYTYNNNY